MTTVDAVESTEVDILLLEASETLKLSVEAKGANNLCLLEMLVFAEASASSFDLTFSKMLLKRPRLTSAVVSLRDFLGNSDRAGVEYSNGGSAKGISSNLFEMEVEVVVAGGGGMVNLVASSTADLDP